MGTCTCIFCFPSSFFLFVLLNPLFVFEFRLLHFPKFKYLYYNVCWWTIVCRHYVSLGCLQEVCDELTRLSLFYVWESFCSNAFPLLEMQCSSLSTLLSLLITIFPIPYGNWIGLWYIGIHLSRICFIDLLIVRLIIPFHIFNKPTHLIIIIVFFEKLNLLSV